MEAVHHPIRHGIPRVPVALCVFVAVLYSLADLPFSMRRAPAHEAGEKFTFESCWGAEPVSRARSAG